MGLGLSLSTLALTRTTHSLGGWLLAPLDRTPCFHNVSWDDFCYIPRVNAAWRGDTFSDPWNNYNPAWRGWGPFGLLPPLVLASFARIAQDYFRGVALWTVVNFLLLSWLVYRLLRGRPFALSRYLALLFSFVLLSVPWLATQALGYHGDLPNILLFGVVRHALTRVECGLLTYLPYVLFLLSYWRWLSAPTARNTALCGACAGLLGYVYFFHYVFAFFLLAARGLLYLLRRQYGSFRLAVAAAAVGLLVMLPALINVAVFEQAFAGNLYHQRLDYSEGRLPSLQELAYLRALLLPAGIGVLYAAFGRASRLKRVLLGELAVLGIAYLGILNLRLLLGFIQAHDHFWRYSLGIPATLWTCGVVADCVRSWLKDRPRPAAWGRAAAMVLPVFILIRGTVFVSANVSRERGALAAWTDTLSPAQQRLITRMEVIKPRLSSGDGFIAADTLLAYHIMVNTRARPFVALGLSPITVEHLSARALVGFYLTGRDAPLFPLADRAAPAYRYEDDLQLYLYINLFQSYYRDPRSRQRFEAIYQTWSPAALDWQTWREPLSNVRVVITETDRAAKARQRLKSVFTIENETEVAGITVFEVRPSIRPVSCTVTVSP